VQSQLFGASARARQPLLFASGSMALANKVVGRKSLPYLKPSVPDASHAVLGLQGLKSLQK